MTTGHEAKARSIVDDLLHRHVIDESVLWDHSSPWKDVAVSAISSALREAEEREREACAKFVESTYRNSEGEALRARFIVPEAIDGYLEAWHQAEDGAAAIRSRNDE